MSIEWCNAKPVESEIAPRRKARRWRDKFREAYRGMKLGIRGHSSFFVHFFFAAMALVAALALQCDLLEWCLIIGCIGVVISAELFNSAVEAIFHGLDAESKSRIRGCLDIAAGAVLVASATAAIIGSLVFSHRLFILLRIAET